MPKATTLNHALSSIAKAYRHDCKAASFEEEAANHLASARADRIDQAAALRSAGLPETANLIEKYAEDLDRAISRLGDWDKTLKEVNSLITEDRKS